MSINAVLLGADVATNSAAAQTGVDLQAAAQVEVGPAFPNIGGNAVAIVHLSPGATPGTFSIALQESSDDSTYTTLGTAITDANYKSVNVQNVTITKRYVRLNVTDATANAGTVTAFLLSA